MIYKVLLLWFPLQDNEESGDVYHQHLLRHGGLVDFNDTRQEMIGYCVLAR